MKNQPEVVENRLFQTGVCGRQGAREKAGRQTWTAPGLRGLWFQGPRRAEIKSKLIKRVSACFLGMSSVLCWKLASPVTLGSQQRRARLSKGCGFSWFLPTSENTLPHKEGPNAQMTEATGHPTVPGPHHSFLSFWNTNCFQYPPLYHILFFEDPQS